MSSGNGSIHPPVDSVTEKPTIQANGKPKKEKKDKVVWNEEQRKANDVKVHEDLRELRKSEVVRLTVKANRTWLVIGKIPYFHSTVQFLKLVFSDTAHYLWFCIKTIGFILKTAFLGGVNVLDFFSVLFFGLGGIALLGVVLPFCLALNFPPLVRIYYQWADARAGGLGLVNSANPKLFKSMSDDQIKAAKEALKADFPKKKQLETDRTFDYDIAKLLLQMAAVVYEHEGDAIRKSVAIVATSGDEKAVEEKAMAIANTHPSETKPQTQAEVKTEPKNDDDEDEEEEAEVVFPKHHLAEQVGEDKAKEVSKKFDEEDKYIRKTFCTKLGVQYEPVSELNDTTSAFSALFWDPDSNWIVVAFKGTAPTTFKEWLSDFNAKMVPAGRYIKGFNKVHEGFLRRVFPAGVYNIDPSSPYNTVKVGIRIVSKYLRDRNGFKDVNVYFTGHSLGCATSTLMYSRFLMNERRHFGKHTHLRDAYLFAAPIVCDPKSVLAFNDKMTEDDHRIKTMWRITSNGDAVATALPELGDYPDLAVGENNAFGFAHLGTEIVLKDGPFPSDVRGHHIEPGVRVTIASQFDQDQIQAQRDAWLDEPWNSDERWRILKAKYAQAIPVLGRVIAHATVNYWDQLDRLVLGQCKWTVH